MKEYGQLACLGSTTKIKTAKLIVQIYSIFTLSLMIK